MNTQDIRESFIPCRCERSGQNLIWLFDALLEVDRLAAESKRRDRRAPVTRPAIDPKSSRATILELEAKIAELEARAWYGKWGEVDDEHLPS